MVLGLMADDVIFMVPGQPPFGKDAFRAGAETMKNVTMQGSAEIRELKVFDGWAYVRITFTPPGGAPVRRAGYTLSVLRKEPGGNWVLARDANLVM
jgi:uncharacterized protein (TIGR02246 family)